MTPHLDDYHSSAEVRDSYQETAPRKTAENTVKHRNGGVGSVVASHGGGGESSVVVTTLEIMLMMLMAWTFSCCCLLAVEIWSSSLNTDDVSIKPV